MSSPRYWISCLTLLTCLTAFGCNQTEQPTVHLPTYLEMSWESLPHRISQLELTADFDSQPSVLLTQNDGGDFGSFDYPRAEYRFIKNSHLAITQINASTTILINPAQDPTSPDAHVGTATIKIPHTQLPNAHQAVALIRGFRIDTNQYETPPAFSLDEELAYDPALGYTTSGFGIWINQPQRETNSWKFTIVARNRLGIGDRADMNSAITQAQVWMRIDYALIGLPKSIHVDHAQTAYTQSHQEFGEGTVHPPPSSEKQAIEFPPRMNTSVFGYGLTGFDIAVNVPGHFDNESCSPQHEPLNAWGEPIGGPGRYIRSFKAGVHSLEHDSQSGQASAQLHIDFSNSSELREIGNLCLGLQGAATLLRSTLPGTKAPKEIISKAEYTSGEYYQLEL